MHLESLIVWLLLALTAVMVAGGLQRADDMATGLGPIVERVAR
jgi:hypothetical protein